MICACRNVIPVDGTVSSNSLHKVAFITDTRIMGTCKTNASRRHVIRSSCINHQRASLELLYSLNVFYCQV